VVAVAAAAALAAVFLSKPPATTKQQLQSQQSSPPAPAPAWRAGTLISATAQFTSVSCPTADFCLATDSAGDIYAYNGSTWSLAASGAHGTTLDGVSCASAGFCAVTSSGPRAYIHSAGALTGSQLTGSSGLPAHLTAISCPAVGSCVATGLHDAYQYANGTWSRGTLVQSAHMFTSISCPTVTFCMAVDDGGDVDTYNGSAWAPVTSPAAGTKLDGVSCASAGFCAVTSTGTAAYIYAAGKWTTSQLHGADGGPAHLKAVSCPAAGQCEAVGGLNTYTYAAGAWSGGTQVQNGNVFTAISCPAASFCVAVNNAGSAFRYAAR
jgi:hypothetical protein